MSLLSKICLLPLQIVAGLLFGLPLLLFLVCLMGIIIVVHYPFQLFSTYRWKQKLRQQDRLISSASILASAAPGTLIIDAPSINSGANYCWWTAEKVRELAPMKILSREELSEYWKTHKEIPLNPFTE